MTSSERSERAEMFVFFRQNHTFLVNSFLVNHILVNTTSRYVRNTHDMALIRRLEI